MKTLPVSWPLATLAVCTFFGLQSLVQHNDASIEQHNISANLSAVVRQCLPKQPEETSTFRLMHVNGALKMTCEKHRSRHWGTPPVRQPMVKFVVALEGGTQ